MDNDDRVKRAKLTSDVDGEKEETKTKQPVADLVLARPQDGFPGSTVVYLTPHQKHIYNNVRHAIVR